MPGAASYGGGCLTEDGAVPLPGLVACDLDGTLVRSDRTISDRTVAAIQGLRAHGVPFVIATGRPPRWLPDVLDRVGREAEVVCVNGAVVLDRDGAALATWPIEPAALVEATNRLRAAVPGVRFAVELGAELRKEPDYPTTWDRGMPYVHDTDLATIVAEPALKLLARLPGANADDLLAEAVRALDGVVTPTHSSLAGLVEISAAGVTKASGLGWLADRLGVQAADVVAFGDMPNDVPMLRWAGRAVVVAGAHDDARAVADHVTGSNDADGVAAVLEQLVR